jgi:hypothetical protein
MHRIRWKANFIADYATSGLIISDGCTSRNFTVSKNNDKKSAYVVFLKIFFLKKVGCAIFFYRM